MMQGSRRILGNMNVFFRGTIGICLCYVNQFGDFKSPCRGKISPQVLRSQQLGQHHRLGPQLEANVFDKDIVQ